MKFNCLLGTSLLVTALASPAIVMAESITDAQKIEIQKIVHDYLVNNPEVLIESSQALQRKQQDAMTAEAQKAILGNTDQLLSDTLTTVGNPKGNVTLVEFFDYQCGHCKKMDPVVDALIKKQGHLKVVYKEFPIFGKSSETASKVALAASMQGKYLPMHQALMKEDKRLTDDIVMKLARSVGLNMDKLKQDMQSKVVNDALTANNDLAQKLRLMGTPAFIIAATPQGQFKQGSEPVFIPGAASEQALTDIIKKAQS